MGMTPQDTSISRNPASKTNVGNRSIHIKGSRTPGESEDDRKHLTVTSHDSLLIGAWILFLFTAILALCWLATSAIMGGKKYLYHIEGSATPDSLPILEYVVKSPKPSFDELHPDFLYKPASPSALPPAPRVVEFYAPWCPHCQHFVPKYIDVAKKIRSKFPQVQFHAVSCVANNELCNDQNVTSFPTIKVFRDGSYEARIIHKFPDASKPYTIVEELGLEAASVVGGSERVRRGLRLKEGSVDNSHHIGQTSDPVSGRVLPFKTHPIQDAWADAALSFDFALRTGIYMHNGPLSPEEQSAFRDFLLLLSEVLPSQMRPTHIQIGILLKNFSTAVSGEKEMHKVLEENGSSHAPRTEKWRTCTNGDNDMGYTCGLWQLFHVMAVGVVAHNRHHSVIPTRKASETLRNYIDHFFQCEVCRVNFLQMYDNCEFGGCHRLTDDTDSTESDWQQLPLWLWETHNDINVRLLGERFEQESSPKASRGEEQQSRWPLESHCPYCWRSDGSWEEDLVFEHLHGEYWTERPLLRQTQTVEESNPEINTGGMGAIKRNLLIVVFATVLLSTAWAICTKRRKYRIGRHKKVDGIAGHKYRNGRAGAKRRSPR